jgi:hypothetical protein
MTDEPEASVLGSLPRSRPQRRSDKRAARPAEHAAEQRPQPEPEEPHRACAASLGDGAELVGTVVKATAELAEIGLTLAARALRNTLSRLPRP